MESLENRLGYPFTTPARLARALTRKAYANEEHQRGRPCEDQEVLSTLGDAILKAIIVDLLVRAEYPTPDAITQEKKKLERRDTLAGIALQLEVGASIKLGAGEKLQKAEKEPLVLAETLEAIIGAIYQDGGFEASHEAVLKWYGPLIKQYHG